MRASLLTTLLLMVITSISCKVLVNGTITNSHEINITCEQQWTCKNRPKQEVQPGQYNSSPGCFCDDMCTVFNDCCGDADLTIQKPVNARLQDYIKCVDNCYIDGGVSLYVVHECPDGKNTALAEQCRKYHTNDLFLQTPLTGKKTGLVYKNIFCAQCHSEDAEFWKPRVNCLSRSSLNFNETTPFNDILANGKCKLQFHQPSNTSSFRPCYTNIITSCLSGSQSLRDRCTDASNRELVFVRSNIYLNKHCAACNSEMSAKCDMLYVPSACVPSFHDFGTYSFSILFDININSGTMEERSFFQTTTTSFIRHNKCSFGEYWDPFTNVCRLVLCDSNNATFTCGSQLKQAVGIFETSPNDTITNCSIISVASRKGDSQTELSESITSRDDRCIPPTKRKILYQNTSHIEEIVSRVGTILSAVSLLITIVIYLTFKKLQNRPGLCILSLSIALFTAEVLMTLAPYTETQPIVCKAFAIGMHYFFLAAFLWMNIIAFDVWFTFSRCLVRAREPGKKRKRFLTYSMYAWMSPLVPVISALTLDLVDSSSVYSPGYGKGICWITSKLSLLIFFAAPLGMIVVLNTIFFICTSTIICSLKKSSARILGSEQRSEFLVYVKLFLVMGITWSLGFLSAFVPHPVTTYLFIVTNTLQGVFIGVSFICTRNVRLLLRQAFALNRPCIPGYKKKAFPYHSTHM
ncbi:uncharacterized protein LOC124132586 [Haliotis rufescens]|uniref:uncharacterized protein LOC124132586 n=1 Tax=Haliotis rufescens TaxID=6454 RepID=UPI001EB053DA|nr:uncharacterized protein LOC124132586 [Haliotis rufescens]